MDNNGQFNDIPDPTQDEQNKQHQSLEPTPVDPALTVTYQKVRLHPEDIVRVLTDKLPGYIPFFTQGGANFPGCRLIHVREFGFISGLEEDVLEHFKKVFPNYGASTVAATVNEFFARFANYYRAHEVPDGQGGLYLYYSSILDEQDTQDLQEAAMETNKVINERRAKRNADMAAAKALKDKETADLMALGRAVRDVGGVNELIDSLQAKLVDLENENRNLRKKQRKGK